MIDNYSYNLVRVDKNSMNTKRSVAMSHRRKDMNRTFSSFRVKEVAIRNLHLNNEIGSSLRFCPLFVLTELG